MRGCAVGYTGVLVISDASSSIASSSIDSTAQEDSIRTATRGKSFVRAMAHDVHSVRRRPHRMIFHLHAGLGRSRVFVARICRAISAVVDAKPRAGLHDWLGSAAQYLMRVRDQIEHAHRRALEAEVDDLREIRILRADLDRGDTFRLRDEDRPREI